MLEPTYDHIVVKHVEPKGERMQGGIILQAEDDSTTQYQEAVVVKVGPGYKFNGDLIPLRVKEGDTVIYRNMAGVPIEDDGVEYHITSESTVLVIKS